MLELSDPLDKLDSIAYGIIFPCILVIGFFGSVINLIILFTTNLKAAHFVYMRGMSICDLLGVLAAIPFAIRLCQNRTEWSSKAAAWYYAHLELYLFNTFAGGDVFLTVAITTERYLAFCHPFKARTLRLRAPRHSHILAFTLPIIAAILYIPYVFRSKMVTIVEVNSDNTTTTVYEVEEDVNFTSNIAYIIYDYSKEIIFRIAPGVILVYMNIRIICTYKKASIYLKRRRVMRVKISCDEVIELQESKRLMIILGGLTIQFVVCTAPAALLALMIDNNNDNYAFAVFRAIANLLEFTKNASTFFVYCLCSGEYRRHLVHCVAKHSSKIHSEKVQQQGKAEVINVRAY